MTKFIKKFLIYLFCGLIFAGCNNERLESSNSKDSNKPSAVYRVDKLNSNLSEQENQANSLAKQGWQTLTSSETYGVISYKSLTVQNKVNYKIISDIDLDLNKLNELGRQGYLLNSQTRDINDNHAWIFVKNIDSSKNFKYMLVDKSSIEDVDKLNRQAQDGWRFLTSQFVEDKYLFAKPNSNIQYEYRIELDNSADLNNLSSQIKKMANHGWIYRGIFNDNLNQKLYERFSTNYLTFNCNSYPSSIYSINDQSINVDNINTRSINKNIYMGTFLEVDPKDEFEGTIASSSFDLFCQIPESYNWFSEGGLLN